LNLVGLECFRGYVAKDSSIPSVLSAFATDWFYFRGRPVKRSDLKPRPVSMAAGASGSYVLAVADESLCFVALAVLFFADTVINCRTCRRINQG
jgi:hypothetical protein